MPIFRVKSVKIYTGQKNLHVRRPWRPWQIWGMPNQSINVNSFRQPHLIFHPPQMWRNQEYLGTFPGLQCFQVNETVGWRHMLVAITGGVHCIKTPYHDIPCQYFTISPPRLIFLSRLPPMKRPNCLQHDLIEFQSDPIFSHKKGCLVTISFVDNDWTMNIA